MFLDVFLVLVSSFIMWPQYLIMNNVANTHGHKQQLKAQATHEGFRLGMLNNHLKPYCVGPCVLLLL